MGTDQEKPVQFKICELDGPWTEPEQNPWATYPIQTQLVWEIRHHPWCTWCHPEVIQTHCPWCAHTTSRQHWVWPQSAHITMKWCKHVRNSLASLPGTKRALGMVPDTPWKRLWESFLSTSLSQGPVDTWHSYQTWLGMEKTPWTAEELPYWKTTAATSHPSLMGGNQY